jgi:hypothetical protein
MYSSAGQSSAGFDAFSDFDEVPSGAGSGLTQSDSISRDLARCDSDNRQWPKTADDGRDCFPHDDFKEIGQALSRKETRVTKAPKRGTMMMSEDLSRNGQCTTGTADPRSNMFVDAEVLKEQVHQDLQKGEPDVADFYKTEGCAQCIARSGLFGTLTLSAIFLNSLWIGIEMDLNTAESLSDAEWYFQFGEYSFFAFFSFEWAVRFFSFKKKRDGFRDKWFCFDSALVALMHGEMVFMPLVLGGSDMDMSNLSMLRMLRLLRLTRMVRFVRSVPELVTLLKSMTMALRSVLSTLSLLLIFMYVFSIVIKSQLKPSDDGEPPDEDSGIIEGFLQARFGRIPNAMWTLLLSGALLDKISDVANQMQKENLVLAIVFFVFVFISSLTVLNMLVGLLCDVVTAVAAAEKEKVMVNFVRSKLTSVLQKLDSDGNGTISKDEFNELVTIPEAVQALNELGVDIANLVSLSDHLFDGELQGASERSQSKEGAPDGGQPGRNSIDTSSSSSSAKKKHVVTNADFLEMIIRLRPDNRPSVLDITDLRKLVLTTQRQIAQRIDPLEDSNDKLASDMRLITEQLDAFCQKHRKIILGADRLRRSRGRQQLHPPPVLKTMLADENFRPVEPTLSDVWEVGQETDGAPSGLQLGGGAWKCGQQPLGLGIAAPSRGGKEYVYSSASNFSWEDRMHGLMTPKDAESLATSATPTTMAPPTTGGESSTHSPSHSRAAPWDLGRLHEVRTQDNLVGSSHHEDVWASSHRSDLAINRPGVSSQDSCPAYGGEEVRPRQPHGEETDVGPGEDFALAFASAPVARWTDAAGSAGPGDHFSQAFSSAAPVADRDPPPSVHGNHVGSTPDR